MSDKIPVNGVCAPGFEAIRDEFVKNFTDRDEVGAAVAAWVDGELVVNLWGGHSDAKRRRRWRETERPGVRSDLPLNRRPSEGYNAPLFRPGHAS